MAIKDFISKYGKVILIGLVIFLALIAVYRACQVQTLRDEYNTLKGQYDLLEKQADAALKQALEYIKSQDARIAEQNKLIELKDKEIAQKYGHIASLNGQLSKLEAEYATLPDKDAAIRNLLLQVNIYKQKCLSFESIINDKDAQLGGWMIKFEAQTGISETWKARYEAEHQLRLDADNMLKIQEKRVKSLKFGSSLKTWIIGGAVAYVGYSLIKGK